jgi:hypothetical protein
MQFGESRCNTACGSILWQAMQRSPEAPFHGSWQALQFFAIDCPLMRNRECADDTPPGMNSVWRSRFVTSPMTARVMISRMAMSESFVRYGRRNR